MKKNKKVLFFSERYHVLFLCQWSFHQYVGVLEVALDGNCSCMIAALSSEAAGSDD